MSQRYTRRRLLAASGTAVGATVFGAPFGDTVVEDGAARERPTCQVETVVSTASGDTATATDGTSATGTATSTVTVTDACDAAVDTSATVDGEPTLQVPPGEVTVTGESTCDPGTELGICVESTGSSLFVMSDLATVQPDGTWSVLLDFEGIDVGATFALTVVREGRALARLPECEVVGPSTTGTEVPPTATTLAGTTPYSTDRTSTPEPLGTGPPSPTTVSAWNRLLRPLVTFVVLAGGALGGVAALLARWRLGGGD